MLITLSSSPNTRRWVCSLLSALVFWLLPSPAHAQTKSFIKTGENLFSNSYLVADNGAFFAQVRATNTAKGMYAGFAIYKGPGPDQNFGRLWGPADSTATSTVPYFLAMQPDGNLCVYQGTGPSDIRGRHWCSMATRPSGQFFAIMQGDGNLCVYAGTGPADNKGHVWCSNSATPVTWIVNAKQLTFPSFGAYGKPATEALYFPGSGQVRTTLDLTNTGSRWAFSNDGTLRWAPENRMCMTLIDNAIFVQACNGSPSQHGWQLAGDGTLRKANVANACVEFKNEGQWRDCCPETVKKNAVLAPSCSGKVKFSYQ